MNNGIRSKIIRGICRLFKIEPDVRLSGIPLLIATILYPMDALYLYNPWFKYDPSTRILEIDGYKISKEAILALTRSDMFIFVQGDRITKMKKRANGTIWMEQLIGYKLAYIKNNYNEIIQS